MCVWPGGRAVDSGPAAPRPRPYLCCCGPAPVLRAPLLLAWVCWGPAAQAHCGPGGGRRALQQLVLILQMERPRIGEQEGTALFREEGQATPRALARDAGWKPSRPGLWGRPEVLGGGQRGGLGVSGVEWPWDTHVLPSGRGSIQDVVTATGMEVATPGEGGERN